MGAMAAKRGMQGYALLIMLAILLAGSLYFIADNLNSRGPQSQQLDATGRALQAARDALANYAATYSDNHTGEVLGYLPCPDTDGDGDANTPCGSQDVTAIGLLPFKTLGLPDLRDGEGQCLWYAVSGHFKNNPKTGGVLNWDTQGQIAIVNTQGTTLLSPEDGEGGAAAVVFAVGPPLAGQSRVDSSAANNVCRTDPATTAHTHYIDSDPTPGAAVVAKTANAPSTFTHANDALSSINNDRLSWLTPRQLFSRIKARRSSTGSALADRLRSLSESIANQLTATNTLPAPANPASPVGSSITYGDIPSSVTFSAPPYFEYYRNWASQYRYVVCNSNTKCLNANTCTGMLLFAGERTAGGPRTAAQLASLASYFEDTTLPTVTSNYTSLATGDVSFGSAYSAMGVSSGGGTILSSQFAISGPAQIASGDDAICLNPLTTPAPPVSVTGFSNIQTVAANSSAVSLSSSNTVLTTGATSQTAPPPPVSPYICSWHGSAVNITTGLRVYFRFNIQARGNGFTLALADSTTNTTPTMCGAEGAALGYSGNNGITPPINSPKLALELDTQGNSARNDPNDHHTAFVFWAGSSRNDNLDNTHGQCATDVTPNTPCNPSTSPGRRTNDALDNHNSGQTRPTGDVYVRLDIVPNNSTSPRTYALTAYLTDSTSSKSLCDLDVLTYDVSTVSTCNLTATTSSLQTTMSSAFIGFTFGNIGSASDAQSIVIDNFAFKNR